MKNVFLLLFLLFISFSCKSDENISIPIEQSDLKFPLVQSSKIEALINKKTLKILSIGNSFTEDMYSYVPTILRNMKIENVVLGEVSYSGCSLYQHNLFYNNQSKVYSFFVNNGTGLEFDVIGSESNPSTSVTLQYALQYTDWDIIILQQSSRDSGLYSTFQPYLYNLLHIIYNNVTNKDIIFGWNSTWAYATNSTHVGFGNYDRNQILMFNAILDATKNVSKDTGINIIIPTGKAIQNLRETNLNNAGDLTRDGYHLDLGIGRYTASSTFVKSVVLPFFPQEDQNIPFIELQNKSGSINLTPENYKICQEAVDAAVKE